eukprot:scaffold121_cov412-Prasinococcus_capsulatus_cf.AAC.17
MCGADDIAIYVCQGTWGGSIRNAAHVIADLASSLHHENGTIAVQGYYDQVRSLKPEERTVIDSYEFDEDAEAKSESVTLFGEAGASTLERRWVRPTIDVVGMWTGFQGNGIKTAIPSRASLKITSRLVPFQNAHECFSLIEAHVKKHVPEGVSFEIHSLANGNDPALMPRNSVSQMAASYVLKALYGKDPVFLYYGGSIPIVSLLSKMLKREPTILAFGLDGLNVRSACCMLSSVGAGAVLLYDLFPLVRADSRTERVLPAEAAGGVAHCVRAPAVRGGRAARGVGRA